MKTVTYDPDLYRLVPCGLTDEMRDGWCTAPDDEDIDEAMRNGYRGMLSAVPDQLPGVVEHSGEPAGWLRHWAFKGEVPVKVKNANGRMAWPYKFKLLPITQRKVLKDDVPLYTHPAPSQPSAEVLVQAALEAALRVCELRLHREFNKSIHAVSSCRDAIRALSAQQIIDSCKGEKS